MIEVWARHEFGGHYYNELTMVDPESVVRQLLPPLRYLIAPQSAV